MATKTLKVKQVRSGIGCPKDQKDTVRALGLKRLHDTVEMPDSPAVRGMIHKVRHLVEVESL